MRSPLLAALACLASLWPLPAGGAQGGPDLGHTAAAEPTVTSAYFTYVPGDQRIQTADLRIRAGQTLRYLNLDPLGYHTVTAVDLEDTDGDGIPDTPIFDSGEQTGMGEADDVVGTARLAPGAYRFYCQVHFDMAGLLWVDP